MDNCGIAMRYILLLFIALLLCSCSRKVYVPVETVTERRDTISAVVLRSDTVIDRDTLLTYISGDTVRISDIRWRWRIHEVRDTVERIRYQTIETAVPYEVTKEVNRLSWWQTALCWTGAIALLTLIIIIILKIKP